jgi:alpha-mannosidase
VRGANRTLWAMDEYARIGNVKLQSIDAPLVSFCRNPILRWAGNGKERYAPLFAVNLFNNQWGTNFPQWIEGDFDFEFVLSETDEKENQ